MRRRPRPRFACPFCGCEEEPGTYSRLTGAGWVLFFLCLLLLCWPLAPFMLLIRERHCYCTGCGITLD